MGLWAGVGVFREKVQKGSWWSRHTHHPPCDLEQGPVLSGPQALHLPKERRLHGKGLELLGARRPCRNDPEVLQIPGSSGSHPCPMSPCYLDPGLRV